MTSRLASACSLLREKYSVDELVGSVGVTDAERVSPRRESGEVILDGEEVGDATRELRGDADDRDVLDKPASADIAEDAVDTEGGATKRRSSMRRLWHS
jgi:hypothetical protein